MGATQNFVEVLNALNGLKSGISGSRIKKLTEIAVENVQLEHELINAAQTHLKTANDAHKLGALYVIDSISRAYHENANRLGETVGPNAKRGTYSGALYNLNNLIQEDLEIVIGASTAEQKEKIGKLLEIWTRSGTFDPSKIQPIKAKYFGDSQLTPAIAQPVNPPQKASEPNANDILKNLAALAGQTPAVVAQPQPTLLQPPIPPAGVPNLAGLSSTDPAVQQAALLQMLSSLQANGQLPLPPHTQPQAQQLNRPVASNSVSQEEAFKSFRSRSGDSRDRGGDKSQFSRRRRDSRSRSPNRKGREKQPPPGHVIGERNVPGTPHYREKFVSFDDSLPSGSIKVLSRTLFIGGVPNYMDERELASVLRPFAEVQSVILNSERKHAFVKVYSRAEAESVISSFNKNGALSLRTRWGVGFGPRDCCDYQHGISIIPIARLTDADRRWVNAAEWGGVGLEKELVPGLVMEEPDIEIGEGVSSKAISKKMPTDGSRNGPRSTKPGEPDDIYTDPLNNATLPSFMQGNSAKANPLAGLFSQQQQIQQPQVAAAPPQTGAANAQLSNLMAFLQQQQQQQK